MNDIQESEEFSFVFVDAPGVTIPGKLVKIATHLVVGSSSLRPGLS